MRIHSSPGMDPVLEALADATRRRVLEAIAARGEASATAIAANLPVSRQAVVKHLAILEQAGLVDARRRGREVCYAARPERLRAAAAWLSRRAAEWDARLSALKRVAESGATPARSAGRQAQSGSRSPVTASTSTSAKNTGTSRASAPTRRLTPRRRAS